MLKRIVIASAILFLACKVPTGEEEKTDPANGTGKTANWSFTITPSHNNFTVPQNGTDTMIVTITRAGGFTGPVNFEVFNPDSGVIVTSEPITTTGAVTTTRILTHVNGPHPPFADAVYGLHAAPVSTEVQGQSLEVHFAIVRKTGTFTLAPATMSVGRGQSVSQRISFIRTNYDAPLPMNIINAPAGVTATFSPNPVTDTVTQMVITADASVPEGVYNIGVRASEGTPYQGTAPVALTVTPPGSFTFSLALSTLALPKNTTVPVGINITRTNFTGPITFTLSGVPPGVNGIVANPATGNNFSISFGWTAAAVAGSYSVVITATAVGVPPVSVTLTLNVS